MNTREAKIEAFGHLLDVQERLRKECPWDRKQTFQSLRPNTIEETFELADALMNNDMHNVKRSLVMSWSMCCSMPFLEMNPTNLTSLMSATKRLAS